MRAVSLRALAGRGPPTVVLACSRCRAVACAATPPRRIDVVGAGFAGVAVTYFLLKQAAEAKLSVSVYLHDAKGVGGGASGVAAGLLNPLSARGTSLWRGLEGCASTERLLAVSEQALGRPVSCLGGSLHPLRSTAGKASHARSGRRQLSVEEAWAQHGLRLPPPFQGVDVYPGGRVIDAPAYLAGLWAACQALGRDAGNIDVQLCTQRVPSLSHLEAQGANDIIICAGAATTLLPELALLPLTTSGGHVAVLDTQAVAPHTSPAVMLPGAGYCAPTGDGSVVVGATKARALQSVAVPLVLG
jgi:glycine/D-amino acid oxidase-like deaminating enzyme